MTRPGTCSKSLELLRKTRKQCKKAAGAGREGGMLWEFRGGSDNFQKGSFMEGGALKH